MEQKARPELKPTIFITGAGRGLGLCLARLFLKKGYRVFAGKHRTAAGLRALRSPDLFPIALDVSDSASAACAAEQTCALSPALDILINNAAICEDERGKVESLDLARVARIMDVNAYGPLRMTKAFLPLLRAGQGKTIVNISSEAGSIAGCWRKGMFGYCMSKTSLNMQSKLLYNYLHKDGFRVLAIHPGWMKTDMGGKKADTEPEVAAKGIYKIIESKKSSGENLYMDYKGKMMRY